MANRKVTMTDLRVIIREFAKGTPLREIERKLGLSRTSIRTYRERAEQIRQEFEQKMFTTPQGERSFSVSIGVAEYDRAYPGASAFFEVADAALYCAKREGKNQVRR